MTLSPSLPLPVGIRSLLEICADHPRNRRSFFLYSPIHSLPCARPITARYAEGCTSKPSQTRPCPAIGPPQP